MLEQITTILRNYKDDQSLEITEETTFEELGLDSLDTVELLMSVEEEFSVTLEMSDEMKSVGQLAAAIEAAK
ncbi:MAG: phosphopantetheine-binding protein [Coriobacteriia bacterium]|nr:phosphopantetheine-binding protein [Coriobacteriia bacterium]